MPSTTPTSSQSSSGSAPPQLKPPSTHLKSLGHYGSFKHRLVKTLKNHWLRIAMGVILSVLLLATPPGQAFLGFMGLSVIAEAFLGMGYAGAGIVAALIGIPLIKCIGDALQFVGEYIVKRGLVFISNLLLQSEYKLCNVIGVILAFPGYLLYGLGYVLNFLGEKLSGAHKPQGPNTAESLKTPFDKDIDPALFLGEWRESLYREANGYTDRPTNFGRFCNFYRSMSENACDSTNSCDLRRQYETQEGPHSSGPGPSNI